MSLAPGGYHDVGSRYFSGQNRLHCSLIALLRCLLPEFPPTEAVVTLIAVLDDDPRRIQAMDAQAKALGLEAVFFTNAPDMVAWLQSSLGGVSLISLDHDLGPNWKLPEGEFNPGDGRDVADWLATQEPQCPVLVHSANWGPAEGMLFALERSGWAAQKVFPFNDLEWISVDWSGKVHALLTDAEAGRAPSPA